NGNWKEVDCRQTVVPSAVIPIQISDYLKANYPDVSVIKIERDRREYEVKLSNRMELKFDMKFRLIDIDM
ncbi:MAG: PepSY-like domain-containing protein, partial [Prevotella sp.]|nr:PepSY-like domain-containing protein [Prevotella sp.]